MIFEGPRLPAMILEGLCEILDRRRFASIAEAVGTETERWAAAGT